jgi:hypothetical protein
MVISYDGIASLCVSAGEDQSHIRRLHTIAFIKLRCEHPTGLGLVDFAGHLNRPTGFKQVQICTSKGPSISGEITDYLEHGSGGWIRFEVGGS